MTVLTFAVLFSGPTSFLGMNRPMNWLFPTLHVNRALSNSSDVVNLEI
jgi:hypothetical protein